MLNSNQDNTDKSLWQINFILYLITLILFGVMICRLCLCQQDICYLLALGRWIIDHGSLPLTDPFSWTYALYPNGCPFVVHQWLTDILFFVVEKALKPTALVMITAIALSFSNVILPLKILGNFRIRVGECLSLLVLSMLSAESHLQVRPEIFSYVFFALYFFILIKADQNGNLSKKNLTILFLGMVLWCNLHSGFLAGLMAVSFWLSLSIIDQAFFGKQKFGYSYFSSLPLCFIATLINPSGYKLWLYLPSLYLSPISHYVSEWRHFDPYFLYYEPFYPLLILMVIFVVLTYKTLQMGKLKDSGLKPILLGLVAIFIGLSVSRFMNTAAFCLIIAIAMLLNSFEREKQNNRLLSFAIPSTIIVIATIIIVTDKLIPAKIADNCAEFTAPAEGVNFLKNHPQEGRLLNDAQYGDFLQWSLQPCPKLFIDSRFDLYDPNMIDRYFKLLECASGWQKSLQTFEIDWVFLPPYFPLVTALHKNGNWQVLYSDYTVVVMHKVHTP